MDVQGSHHAQVNDGMGLGRFGGGGLAQNTFKEFFKNFQKRKVFLENISFWHLRSLFARHVTCHAQF